MIEIIFQHIEDAKRFFNHLESHIISSELDKQILQYEDHHIIKIQIDASSKKELEVIKNGFYKFIIKIKRKDWFRGILSKHYYFEDPEEQQQIIDIIYSILSGNREDMNVLLKDLDNSDFLWDAVDDIFSSEISFSFDSFVLFRLKPFIDQLERYVEISIDEYKMEQEYQIFVQTLREFLVNRQPRINYLHLIIEECPVFFNEHFCEIKRSELIKMIDRKLLVNHPVYVDSVTIAPLLSIAPLTVYLYTNDPDQALVRTITNILEERVVILSIKDFYKEKNLYRYTADEKM